MKLCVYEGCVESLLWKFARWRACVQTIHELGLSLLFIPLQSCKLSYAISRNVMNQLAISALTMVRSTIFVFSGKSETEVGYHVHL